MRLGINTFLFACPFTNQSTRWFARFKKWGFETVEISVESPARCDPAFVKAQLDKHGLKCGSVTPCLGPDKDLRGTAAQQRAGVDFMKKTIDVMLALDCPSLIGALYSLVGRCEAVPAPERRRQWKTVAANLRELCLYAAEHNRILALEPLNRFETDFINTCEQALQMIHDVGSPALKLHLDTFHMNIEEKDPARAIRKAGRHLGHFHACGCDRGTPGKDHIDWQSIAAALKAIRYEGDVVIESFTADNKVIARAASIWRQIEPTREEIACDGVKFLRRILKSSP
jgi:D-psicose/D-tagatose/L-ribulose 3-epimerase